MMKPAVAVLSTGSVCYPLNRPVLAFYQVKDVVFQWLMGDTINLNQIDAEDPKITDYTMLPDTGCLSVRLRVHLQEENPRDFTSLFDMSTQAIKHFAPSHQVENNTALETGQTSVHYRRP
uniref:Intraflagellar transport 52 homolog (Chlamydomonas) n=1 Tax=Hucho hucho TaxID=62062 RepID=A0A4W5QT27_9TELE